MGFELCLNPSLSPILMVEFCLWEKRLILGTVDMLSPYKYQSWCQSLINLRQYIKRNIRTLFFPINVIVKKKMQ